jgi:hypothetical protein
VTGNLNDDIPRTDQSDLPATSQYTPRTGLPSETCRLFLLGAIIIGALFSIGSAVCIFQCGGMNFQNFLRCLGILLGIYIPLISLVIAFYQGRAIREAQVEISFGGFVFMVAIVIFMIVLVPVFGVIEFSASDLKEVITVVQFIYSSIVIGIIGYFFGKEKKV